jgi:hypothetical protein
VSDGDHGTSAAHSFGYGSCQFAEAAISATLAPA